MLDTDEVNLTKNETEGQNISEQPDFSQLESQDQSRSKNTLDLMPESGDQIQVYGIENDGNHSMPNLPI